MTKQRYLAVVLASLAACSNNSGDVTPLRAAVNDAQVKLGDTVVTAEASMANGRAVTAELRLAPIEYSIGTVANDALHDVRLDTHDGHIISNVAAGGAGTADCPSSITLAAAIAKAEAKIDGGTVVAAIPDDDVACAREIQVLADILWEVKVAGDGSILEVEESDETED